jgi:hypothetical protein
MVRPVAARPVMSCPAQPEAARRDARAGFRRREDLKAQAHPSAAAARKAQALQAMAAQRLAQVERLALQAGEAAAVLTAQQVSPASAAQPTAVPGVWDVAVVPQPAAEPAGAARRREVAAVQDVAAGVQRRAAGPASVAAPLRGAQQAVPDAEEAPQRGAEVPDAEVLRRAARGGAVLLLAAAWAGLLSTRPQGGRPAPSAPARSAHARGCLRTARP